LTDPCCGTSEWIYHSNNDDYDGDLDDVDVDENALFWREYNPKRELHSLQLQVENSNLSPQKRSYLEKKIRHMSRDPMDFHFQDDDDDDYDDDDNDDSQDDDLSTLLTMDESLMEGKMSGMEVAVRKFKHYQRAQRYMTRNRRHDNGGDDMHTTYSF
jgi:hypothetical protein